MIFQKLLLVTQQILVCHCFLWVGGVSECHSCLNWTLSNRPYAISQGECSLKNVCPPPERNSWENAGESERRNHYFVCLDFHFGETVSAQPLTLWTLPLSFSALKSWWLNNFENYLDLCEKIFIWHLHLAVYIPDALIEQVAVCLLILIFEIKTICFGCCGCLTAILQLSGFIFILKFLSHSCFVWRFGTVSLKLMMSHFNQKVGVVLQSLRRSIRSIQANKQDCKMAGKHHSVQYKQMSFEVMGKVSVCTQTLSDWLAVQAINMFTPHSYWFGGNTKYFPALV